VYGQTVADEAAGCTSNGISVRLQHTTNIEPSVVLVIGYSSRCRSRRQELRLMQQRRKIPLGYRLHKQSWGIVDAIRTVVADAAAAGRLLVRQYHIAHDRIDLRLPALATEYAVVANTGLHVMTLHVRLQARA
jgi:hypothetical protein